MTGPSFVYFKLSFPPGLAHDRFWFGTLDDASPFVDLIEMMFWQDDQGVGWGICQSSSWDAYALAMTPLASENQSVVQVPAATVAQAIDPANWSF